MASRSRTRGRRGHAAAHESEERWLLTYADMITLLMALFMVLFSISSVNISKFQTLQKSTTPNTPKPIDISQAQLKAALASAAAATAEQQDFEALKVRIDAYAVAHGFSNQVQTLIQRRGLVVRVLTDKLLFDSGKATLKAAGLPLLNEMADLLNEVDQSHPIVVEGYTDNVPIASSEFPSNWELSTARATTVVRYLIAQGVNQQRLGAAGYADLHPVASNAAPAGRALNRRVEIVFERINPVPPS